MPANEHAVYLTFDDGPHPQITPWVLEQLKKYNALATFFCIGKNVLLYPEVYERIQAEGHSVGNHTQHHVNGWKVSTETYLDDVRAAAQIIKSRLFRPPYGRIKKAQAAQIKNALQQEDAKIVMWDVLSADFDAALSPEQCVELVLKNATAGSVIVFHDSEKAAPNLQFALPKVLEALSRRKYVFKRLD
jgi:peptidoglycan/xylan/chitin deacetylase (PgdA/CDA1 family)